MKIPPFLACLPLAFACGLACAAPPAPAAAASASAASAASAGCPAPSAASQARPLRTSKGRHVPDERDPCADSRGAVPAAH